MDQIPRNRVALALLGSLVVLALSGTPLSSQQLPTPSAAAPTAPGRLSDEEFWRLSTEFSEPDGAFNSDNLVCNERLYQTVVPGLASLRGKGAYLGVAPEQNFTYVVALAPKIAFVVDIRRGNLHLHLMYKALFGLSRDRAEFLSKLFSRPRPDGVGTASSAAVLFDAFVVATPTDALYDANLKAVLDYLAVTHHLPLDTEDRLGIAYVYRYFRDFGPQLRYQNGRGGGAAFPNLPTFAAMHQLTDAAGVQHNYMATETNFQAIKTFQDKNLLVPVVGDFAGPKALRAIGRYLTEQRTPVAAFYISNVEQYLFQNKAADRFYENVATLPTDDSSVFIRNRPANPAAQLLDHIKPMLEDARAGKFLTYADVMARVVR